MWNRLPSRVALPESLAIESLKVAILYHFLVVFAIY